MSANVNVKSIEGSKLTQEVKTGEHVFLSDEPSTFGGTDQGPTPYEFLLAALGT